MQRKSSIVIVVLAVSITLSLTLIAVQQNGAPQSGAGRNQTNSSQVPQRGTKSNAGRDNERAAQNPIQITVTTPEKSPADKAAENQQREREVAAQETVAYFTRVLTFLAVIQAVITALALGASIRAANAAKNSADIAASTLRLTQRAHLFAVNWKLTDFEPGKFPLIEWSIKNSGSSPGRLIKANFNLLLAPDLTDATPVYGPEETDEGNFPIYPDIPYARSFRITKTGALSQSVHAAVIDGTHRLWFWGFFTYADPVGEHRFGWLVTYERDRNSVSVVQTKPGYNHAD
jgi:hypothetical protein